MTTAQDKTKQRSDPKRDQRPKLSKTMVNFWLDTSMLIVFLAMIWVSTVVRFLFPPAAAALGWRLWGLSLDGWIQLQFALVALFSFGVLVHLMLHWTWVCGVLTNRLMRRRPDGRPKTMDDGTRTILGVGLMIVLLNILGLLMVVAALTIQGP